MNTQKAKRSVNLSRVAIFSGAVLMTGATAFGLRFMTGHSDISGDLSGQRTSSACLQQGNGSQSCNTCLRKECKSKDSLGSIISCASSCGTTTLNICLQQGAGKSVTCNTCLGTACRSGTDPRTALNSTCLYACNGTCAPDLTKSPECQNCMIRECGRGVQATAATSTCLSVCGRPQPQPPTGTNPPVQPPAPFPNPPGTTPPGWNL
jgi:hypothetical protein